MAQPLVLAIEPDLRQAAIVKRIVRENVLAEVAVVDSRDAAIEAMRTSMPDVLLLSALLSPRDEDELIAHLKTLDNAGHLQTHTIPQLASALNPGEERASRGLLSAFRRKKGPAPVVSGCDPELFAEEIRMFLQRAADKKRELQSSARPALDMRQSAADATRPAAAVEETPAPEPSSSWSSPFEWKSSDAARTSNVYLADPAPVDTAVPAPPAPDAYGSPDLELDASVSIVAPPLGASAAIGESEAEPLEPVAAAPEIVAEAYAAAPPPPAEALVLPRVEPVDVPMPVPVPEVVTQPRVAAWTTPTAARVPLRGIATIAHVPDSSALFDRLGPVARWARTEAPRAAKAAPVTADDIRALIASLAVPPAVASVTYPSGCRIRRVRVPVSPDHDGGEGAGPVILSRRSAAEQRDRQTSAQEPEHFPRVSHRGMAIAPSDWRLTPLDGNANKFTRRSQNLRRSPFLGRASAATWRVHGVVGPGARTPLPA